MLPSSIRTFMSLIQAPSTPRSVEVARLTPCLMASSKPVSETTLSSVTLATDICSPLPWLALSFLEHLLPAPAGNKRSVAKTHRLDIEPRERERPRLPYRSEHQEACIARRPNRDPRNPYPVGAGLRP